jgi:GrpB-like predicted nucleotidyltransferase (UPF0157 family)
MDSISVVQSRGAAMAAEATFHLADDPEWARRAAEALFRTLERNLTPNLPASAELLHVVATAIPGCLTKGDLDVVVRIGADDFAVAEAVLADRFARNAGSIRTADFAAFEGVGTVLALGLQLTVRGGRFDVFHHFVLALRADPILVVRYNVLKTRHAGAPMDAYRAAKDAFVGEVLGAWP